MKILLLGASSYVGARLYLDLSKDHEVVGTYDHNQLSPNFKKLDVTQPDEVRLLVTEIAPDVIIHAANNANGRWCEANPELARALNETSTQTVVDAANSIGAKLIYISSFAAIEPSNIYGKTKQASEEITKQVKSGWVIIRPSLIIGYSPNTTNDRPFNRLLKNLDEGTKAEYDESWKFQPTWLHHISEVIEGVLQKDITEQIIPVAVNELASRYEFARDILEPLGVHVSAVDARDTSPVFQEDLSLLEQLGLPSYSYEAIVERIVKEIQEREKYILA